MPLRRSIGPYELLRVLDTGGMGKVYLAKERRRGLKARHVVVKTIRSELEQAPEHVAAFQRETRILARLQHPNIVRLYDAGRAGTRLYMVMEYLEGLDVAKMLRLLGPSGRKVPLGLVLRVGVEAARALHAAHAYTTDSGKLAGLVHRDLSPHNVFVLYDGRVKLLDFGLARAYSESAATGDGMVKGKFRYLAPEQARGEDLDGRVDIFTLGLVLHEMITGKRAYDQTGDVEVLRAAMQGQFVRLSALAPDTPAPLLRVVERAVRGTRGERYPSAAAMADDLAQAAAELGLPVEARDHHAFLREMRALADASPLAATVEPSGRLSTNVRSSLTSVADIDTGAGAVVEPKPVARRLGLWAGGLGAAVGALAAIINLAASSGGAASAAEGAPASALAPADTAMANAGERALPADAPARQPSVDAQTEPAKALPSEVAAEPAKALPSEVAAEPTKAPPFEMTAEPMKAPVDAPAELAKALPTEASAELAATPTVVPVEAVVAEKAMAAPVKVGAAAAPRVKKAVAPPKPGLQFSGHSSSKGGVSPQPYRRAAPKRLPAGLSRDRR